MVSGPNDPGTADKAPEGHRSGLVEAMLRIASSLELETVLREVVESARALTGARYAAMATIDEAGQPRDFVTSGFTDEEHRALVEWPDGPKLFEFFRDLPGPLRIPDVPAYVRSLGFSADVLPSRTFQGTPMRHRGQHVGNFYLVEKEGGEPFTDADEEVLLMFAAQAAAAVAHARAYRDERRARADLEALIATSPVGVVVFDAATGGLVSINREAARLVEGLRVPGHGTEDLLQTITCRRADGREVALAKLPLSSALSSAETVRAEEMELSAEEGRRVSTLVNATPIHTEDGTLASMVVTLQDLTPLEELERTRTEFLRMVSHELRAPLAAIKGSAAIARRRDGVFAWAEIEQFFSIIEEQADRMTSLISNLLDAGRIASGTLSVAPEPEVLAHLVDRARDTFVRGGGRHPVVIDLPPDLPRVLADRDRVVQVLNNLLANAARYSPDRSPIRVEAVREGVHVAVAVADQGQGIAPEHLARLFRKHARDSDEQRGGGLGLVICKGLVEAQGGRIRAESDGFGQGARFTFTLPVADEAADNARGGGQHQARREEGRPARILVVDDDPDTLRLVRHALTEAGYAPLVTGDHGQLAHILATERPALVLLDLVLPGTDGIELMQRVPGLADLPVVFISGYGRGETVARALEAGAEDYVVKPFSPTELVARVRAALRRRSEPEPFVLGDLSIDYDRRRVTVRGRAVELTATEYELLRVLSLRAGRVATYEWLLRQVWSTRTRADAKRVRAYIKRLRKKLGDDARQPVYIQTELRVGYRMRGLGDP